MLGRDKDGSSGELGDETLAEILERAGADTQSHLMPTQQGPPVRSMTLTQDIGLAATEVSGRYTNATEYGRGGMGRVLLVHDSFLSREVALKELIAETDSTGQTVVGNHTPAESAHFLQRFLREARITGNLEHPSIVPVYELGRRPDGGHYYTMKFVRGRTLHRAIRDARTLEDRLKLLPHVIDLCNAIAYAHSKGVIHRDIKPSNVMVGSYGETVVIDWGLARVLDQDDPYAAALDVPLAGDAPEDAAQTMAGVPVGTPQYMSPEQAAGRLDDVGTHSDVYALGVVLYEVLAGRTPFTGAHSRDVLRQVLHTRPAPVTTHEPGVPPALARICTTAMARRPEDRFGSAAELADELVRFSTGALVKIYDYNFWELARHYYRKNRALCNSMLASAAVVMVVVVVAYAYILDANRKERIQRQAAEAEAYRANIQVAATDIKNQSFEKARERLLLQPPHLRDWEWGLLFAQCHQDYATGSAHTERVYRLVNAPNTNRIISIGDDERVIVWSTPDLEKLHEFDIPTLPGINVDISADESRLVLSQMGQGVRLYDMNNYELLRTFAHDGDAYVSGVISGDGQRIAAGTQSGALVVLDAKDGREIRRDSGDGTVRHAYAMNHDGNTLLAVDNSENTVLVDASHGEVIMEIVGSRPRVSENRESFSIVSNGFAELYDMNNGDLLFRTGKSSSSYETAFQSMDGSYMVTVENRRYLQVWETSTGILLSSFDARSTWRTLGLSPRGDKVALASLPNTVEVWDTLTGRPESRFLGHSDHVEAGAFGINSEFFISGSRDKSIKSWRHQVVIPEEEAANCCDITGLSWSREANILAASSMNGTVHFLRDSDFSNVLTVSSHSPNTTTLVALSPSGETATLLANESQVLEISLSDGTVSHRYPSTESPVRALGYSPSGKAVAVGKDDGTIDVWIKNETDRHMSHRMHSSGVSSLTFLSDDKLIATGDREGNCYIWEWRTGNLRRHLQFTGKSIDATATAKTNSSLAIALSDNSIRIISSSDSEQQISLLGHSDPIRNLEYSRAGNRLFSTSFRGELKIWNANNGQELLTQDSMSLRKANIAAMDSALVLGGKHNTLAVYPTMPTDDIQNDPLPLGILSQHKRSRLNTTLDHLVPLRTGALASLVTKHTIIEAAERLRIREELHSPTIDGYLEPAWNPLFGIGLRAGDRIYSMNGSAINNSSDFHERWLRLSQADDSAIDDLTLMINRNGDRIDLRFFRLTATEVTRQFVLTRDEALALTDGIRSRLGEFGQVFVDYSHNLSSTSGAYLPSKDSLDGFWIPPAGDSNDSSVLQAYGLMQRDKVVSIDGKRISSFAKLQADLLKAKSALNNGWSGTIELLVERSKFVQISIDFVVR